MNLKLDRPTLLLEAGQLLTLDDARGARIEPREGVLWITQEGEPRDFVVAAGECFVVCRDGRTLVQAIEPARVRLGGAGWRADAAPQPARGSGAYAALSRSIASP